MTRTAASGEIQISQRSGVLRLTLNRPGRGNSLTTGLLGELSRALENAGTARAVILTGTGTCFSSGGDVAAMREHDSSPESLEEYCDALVGTLNRVLLQIRALPCPVIAAVNGPVTGGSLGLVLASDLSLMSRSAFIQPYYAKLGFAPDGGWTALLPDRIGRASVASWLALDRRVTADEALEMRLVDRVVDPAGLEAGIAAMLAELGPLDASAIASSRRLLDAQCGSDVLAARLDAERRAFLVQIARPETRARMDHFLAPPPQTRSGGTHA